MKISLHQQVAQSFLVVEFVCLLWADWISLHSLHRWESGFCLWDGWMIDEWRDCSSQIDGKSRWGNVLSYFLTFTPPSQLFLNSSLCPFVLFSFNFFFSQMCALSPHTISPALFVYLFAFSHFSSLMFLTLLFLSTRLQPSSLPPPTVSWGLIIQHSCLNRNFCTLAYLQWSYYSIYSMKYLSSS